MEIRYEHHYSSHLGREMEFKIYGHRGKPVIFFPCQGGRFYDFENFHMLDHWANWIEEGRCTVYSVDGIDNETYAAFGAPCRQRTEQHERWYRYIVDEFVPTVRHLSGLRNGFDWKILTFGCSLGAMHAANVFFRRPDLFDSVFAISGVYDSAYFFADYMDDLLYQNTPVTYLANMPFDHPYISMYNQSKMLFAVGQGAWEGPLKESTARLDTVLKQKGIHAQFEYWGYDVSHDWYWWFRMVEQYAPDFLY